MRKRFKFTYIVLAMLFAVMCGSITQAQQLNSEQVKTAYLFNFLKHVSFANEENKDTYTIAIYQDEAFFNIVNKELSQRRVKNKPITVISVQTSAQAKQADMVFVAVNQEQDIALIASDLRKTNTLLVTFNSVDKHNIMLNLFLNQASSAIMFEVNKSNIVYEGITMSKELLLLGGTEIEVAELYRETELAMQKMRKREAELNKDLQEQDRLLKETSASLQRLNSQLSERQRVAEQRQVELLALKKDIDRQKQAIEVKEQQLSDTIAQLTKAKENFVQQQQSVAAKERENMDMEERIAYNRDVIDNQKAQIDQQGLQLDQKNVELEERSELIKQQQFYLMVLAIAVAVVVLFAILLIWLFAKNKRTTRKLSKTLTNLKSMQDQLVQSEKLASLGKLTAGVAHEINTPLGIAVTATSSALESTKEIKNNFEANNLTKSGMSRYFTAIEQAADLNMSSLERVIELLNNFKQVAADQVVGEERDINLTNYINEIMRTLSAELKRHKVTYQYLGDTDIEISTIPGALAQIVTNLVTNSLRHGFEGREQGLITIEVHKHPLNVEIVYSDDGIGMEQEVLRNIFEPFFTTKRNSGGTGLGMNIVFNIISQKLQGDIAIDSQPNQGAKFTLTLPYAIDNKS